MSMLRYAVVRGLDIDKAKVAQYLPKNYVVIWEGETDWYYFGYSNTWRQSPELGKYSCVVIQGRDNAGWTLDKYVIPRLGSGLMVANEIDLSHPLMEEIPA